MMLKKYLEFCKTTAVYPKIVVLKHPTVAQMKKCKKIGVELIDMTWIYPLVGLVGEVGELSNKLKKVIRDGGFYITPEMKKILMDEKGDISWYDAMLDKELKIDPDKKIKFNIQKLKDRKKKKTIHDTGKRHE